MTLLSPELLIESMYFHAWATASLSNLSLLKNLHERFESYEYAWKHATNQLLSTLSPEIDITGRKPSIDPKKEWEKLEESTIRLIVLQHPDYPELLKQLPHPPLGIYVQGRLCGNSLHNSLLPLTEILSDYVPLSVVGTRRPSPYGIIQTQKIIQALAQTKTLIISGLAHGIDTVAHETALLENLPTWAVIGHGHKKFSYARLPLVKLILESNLGCIISEYSPDTPALNYHFPQRNQIIAGLSGHTLVTEAPARSGALITARSAFEANREVFALTADIDRDDCAGNLYLIESQTATPITSYTQLPGVLHGVTNSLMQDSLFPAKHTSRKPAKLDDPQLQSIIDTLTYKYATPVSQLFDSCNIPNIGLLFQKLSELEIEGLIEQIPGGYRLIR